MAFFTYLKRPVEISENFISVKDGTKDGDFILDENNFNDFQETLLLINKMDDVEEERVINSPNERLKQKFMKFLKKFRLKTNMSIITLLSWLEPIQRK